jgi:hypothetical protein
MSPVEDQYGEGWPRTREPLKGQTTLDFDVPTRDIRRSEVRTLTGAADYAASRGWISRDPVVALYVSAGADTKAPVYLRNERIRPICGEEIEAPQFFVYVDKGDILSRLGTELTHSDEYTRVETLETVPCMAVGHVGHLLHVRVTSDRYPSRDVAVLRIRMENETFGDAALAEGWSPDWFIGICDGCAGFGGNWRCENEIRDLSASIPIRLKVRYWVTDHFNCCEIDLPPETHVPHLYLPLPNGSVLRQMALISRHWRSSNSDQGSRIFELKKGETDELNPGK